MLTGKPFDLEIITPERIAFEGKVESVTVPGAYRPFQILYNHAPIIAELEVGQLRFNDSSDKLSVYATGGGFVQVLNNKVSIVVESAEDALNIDLERAEQARLRAEERLRRRDEVDFHRAKFALIRAMNRIKTAKYTEFQQ
jgi:F-type H+-transporting ATPase subunit epsilon